jgi:chromosomal replication initiation ATPase DnaA
MLMVIAKQNFQRTYEKIGTYFWGRNHSAVIYAVNDFPKKIKADQTLRHDYNVVLDYMKR